MSLHQARCQCGGPLNTDGATDYICARCGDEWFAETLMSNNEVAIGMTVCRRGSSRPLVVQRPNRVTATVWDESLIKVTRVKWSDLEWPTPTPTTTAAKTPERPQTFIIEHCRMGPTVRWGPFTLDEAYAWQRENLYAGHTIGQIVPIHTPEEGVTSEVWNSQW